MLAKTKDTASGFIPGKRTVMFVTLALVALTMMSGGVAAQDNLNEDQAELKNTLQSIGNFVSLLVLGIAVPNGAYGFLQYMTAGSNVDQDEKGRTRIRNTFIALAGVAVIQLAVRVFTTYANLDVGTDDGNETQNALGVVDGAVDTAFTGVTHTVGFAGDAAFAVVTLL